MARIPDLSDPVRALAHAKNRIRIRLARSGRPELIEHPTMDDFLVPDISDTGLWHGLIGCEMCNRLVVKQDEGTRVLEHLPHCSLVVADVTPQRTIVDNAKDYNWATKRYNERPCKK